MHRREGFTFLEIMIVVSIIGVLASIAIPGFLKARSEARKTLCINNLRIISDAKEQWAMTHGAAPGDPVNMDQVNSFIRRGAPSCPGGGLYTYEVVGIKPKCSLADTAGHIL